MGEDRLPGGETQKKATLGRKSPPKKSGLLREKLGRGPPGERRISVRTPCFKKNPKILPRPILRTPQFVKSSMHIKFSIALARSRPKLVS
jgi:hypothetical protein